MNTLDTFRILFNLAVRRRNIQFLDGVHNDCTQHKFPANDILEEILKNNLIDMAKTADVTTTQQFIQFAIIIAKKRYVNTHVPALLIKDLIDAMPVDKCKGFFIVVENNIEFWKDDIFYKNTSPILLRLCNNMLARLSNVQEANFRGRILIFLSKLLPLYERSGCNVDNQYNTECLVVKSESSPDSNIEFDINLNFDNFILLQKYLMEPDKCVTKEHWDTFLQCTAHVLKFFDDNDIQETESSLSVSQISGKCQWTYEMLRASVYNARFRREILVQMLIVHQHLNSKLQNTKQLEALKTNTVAVYKILESIPPDGQQFVTRIRNILEREKRWSAWKSAGCPELPKPASAKLNLPPIKRTLGDIWKEKNKGKVERSHVTTTLDDCKAKERNFLPTLTSYLDEAAKELSPESTVAEQSKKIYNGNFGWKAIRLIANRSRRFFDYQKEPMADKPEFLKMMILRVLDAEQDSAEVTDDDEASGSTIKVSITNAEFEALFGTLGEDWKPLALKLGFAESEIESVAESNPTPSSRASCILRSWFEGPSNPSIEYFCSIMDSIGHSEISQIIKLNYLGIDTYKSRVKNETEIEDKLSSLNVQDIGSPESLVYKSDDEANNPESQIP